MTSELTTAIDSAELIRFRLQEHAELEGVGACLTALESHIAHLERLREQVFVEECRVSDDEITAA
ncbi:MAG: hypothetical protein L0H94_14645 [Nitrospira sp.]|nr:hypothetical protein [Nitrospira sp.]